MVIIDGISPDGYTAWFEEILAAQRRRARICERSVPMIIN